MKVDFVTIFLSPNTFFNLHNTDNLRQFYKHQLQQWSECCRNKKNDCKTYDHKYFGYTLSEITVDPLDTSNTFLNN